jgi:hypothetical protein
MRQLFIVLGFAALVSACAGSPTSPTRSANVQPAVAAVGGALTNGQVTSTHLLPADDSTGDDGPMTENDNHDGSGDGSHGNTDGQNGNDNGQNGNTGGMGSMSTHRTATTSVRR